MLRKLKIIATKYTLTKRKIQRLEARVSIFSDEVGNRHSIYILFLCIFASLLMFFYLYTGSYAFPWLVPLVFICFIGGIGSKHVIDFVDLVFEHRHYGKKFAYSSIGMNQRNGILSFVYIVLGLIMVLSGYARYEYLSQGEPSCIQSQGKCSNGVVLGRTSSGAVIYNNKTTRNSFIVGDFSLSPRQE